MRILLWAASSFVIFILAISAFAAPDNCTANAGVLLQWHDRIQLEVENIDFRGNSPTFELAASGLPPCLHNPTIHFEANQSTARRWLSTPSLGPVLFVQNDGGRRFTILAQPEVTNGLKLLWAKSHNLSSVLGSTVSLEFVAYYSSAATLLDYTMPKILQNICHKGYEFHFSCGSFAGATMSTSISCSGTWLATYLNGLEVADPFITGANPMASVSAFTSSDCDTVDQTAPFVTAMANDFVFNKQTSSFIRQPAIIRMKVGLTWPH